MMDLKNKFLFKTLLGFTIGLMITATINSFLIPNDELADGIMLFLQFIGSGLFGAIAMGGSIVYEFESWSIARATITHYLATFISFVIVNRLLGWFGQDVILIAIIILSIGYLMIWLTEYLIWKKQVRELNKYLGK